MPTSNFIEGKQFGQFAIGIEQPGVSPERQPVLKPTQKIYGHASRFQYQLLKEKDRVAAPKARMYISMLRGALGNSYEG